MRLLTLITALLIAAPAYAGIFDNNDNGGSSEACTGGSCNAEAKAYGGDAKAYGGSAKIERGAIDNENKAYGGNASQYQNQKQKIDNSGNNTGNADVYVGGDSYAAQKRNPVSTAYAPSINPTTPCIVTGSAGASFVGFSASAGGGIVDEGCEDRETARLLALLGRPDTGLRYLCSKNPKLAAIFADSRTEANPYNPCEGLEPKEPVNISALEGDMANNVNRRSVRFWGHPVDVVNEYPTARRN